MKVKNRPLITVISALCAITLVSLYCTKLDFNNPLDPDANDYNDWWEKSKPSAYIITLRLNGGILPDDIDTVITTDSTTGKLAQLPVPTKKGYHFGGWFRESAFKTPADTDTKFTANSTIYAKWVDIYTITFDPNGGNQVSPKSGTTNVNGNLAIWIPTPTRDSGYSHTGWFTERNGGIQITPETKFSSNDTIYAQWTKKPTYTIVFISDSAAGTVAGSITADTTGKLAFLPAAPEKTGYEFEGWHTVKGSKINLLYVFSANDTVYARWKRLNYTIKYYDLDSATVSPSNRTSYNVETSSFTLNNPTKKGYVFVGWTGTDISGNTPQMEVTIPKGSTGNRNYTAHWNRDIIITFDAGSGSLTTAQNTTTVDDNGRPVELPNPSPPNGFVFYGWYTEPTSGFVVNENSKFQSSTTIYAQYGIVITYDYNGKGGANVKNNDTINTNAILQDLPKPTETNYSFVGWYANSLLTGNTVKSISGNTENRTYYAKWTPVKYTITYVIADDIDNKVDEYDIETEVTLWEPPIRPGYTFVRWYDNYYGNTTTFIPKGTTGDKVFFAEWDSTAIPDGPGESFIYDGIEYHTTIINRKIWMAENLNYKGSGTDTVGMCYDNLLANCSTYGRLYTWAEAMGINGNGSDKNHRGICPSGWHIPNDAEWNALINYVGKDSAGIKLKSQAEWYLDGNGTDLYRFGALPGGYYYGYSEEKGLSANWWSSTKHEDNNYANRWRMYHDYNGVVKHVVTKTDANSVRCVKD